MSRCHDCDKPLATDADSARFDADEGGSDRWDEALCWREWNNDRCQSEPVDWRTRALKAETEVTLYQSISHACPLDFGCEVHGREHGREAAALREGIERVVDWLGVYREVEDGDVAVRLRKLLDKVDAADSLQHLETLTRSRDEAESRLDAIDAENERLRAETDAAAKALGVLAIDRHLHEDVCAACRVCAATGRPIAHEDSCPVGVWLRARSCAKAEVRGSDIPHAVDEHGDCASWCRACDANRRAGLNPDGTRKDGDR